MNTSRFSLRAAIIGYAVATVFALNGLLTGIIESAIAAGGSELAIITCLGAGGPNSLPGQRDHSAKCSCSLSCCCAAGDVSRASQQIRFRPSSGAGLAAGAISQPSRDLLADRLYHLRSPPDFSA